MSESKPPTFQEVLLAVLERAGRFVRRQLSWVAFAIALFGVGALVWSWTEPLRVRKVVIYTATNAGDAKEYGKQIKAHFAKADVWWLLRYEIEVKSSDGLQENRAKVTEARPGELVLGFDQDGFAPTGFGTVRTLLPLTEMYLHVVANREATEATALGARATLASLFEQKVKTAVDAKQPPTLRCYLGPRGSGSRQIAEVVLGRALKPYKLDLTDADFGEHLSWEAAYTMLARKEIDVIFDGSDLGSAFMGRMASRGSYTLLGLDDVDGLVGSNPHAGFRPRTIPKGSYVSGNGFSREDVRTVATQRLIICPDSMSDFDAYFLARGSREALRDRIPDVRWDKPDQSVSEPRLICIPHPGADDFRRGQQPGLVRMVSNNWQWFLSIVGGFLFFVFRQKGWKWLASDQPVAVPPSIGSIPNQKVRNDRRSRPIPFTIQDASTPADKLTVAAASSDQGVVRDDGIEIDGMGGQRTVRVTPVRGVTGPAVITVTVRNEKGTTGTTQFTVIVTDGSPLGIAPAAAAVGSNGPLLDVSTVQNGQPTPVVRGHARLPVLEKLFRSRINLERDFQDLPPGASSDVLRKMLDRAVSLQRKADGLKEELGAEFAADLDDVGTKLRDLKRELEHRLAAAPAPKP